MKKKIPMLCSVVSGALVLAFVIKTVVDFVQYSPEATSAPFSVCILVNALCLLVPAAIVLAVGIILKKRR